MSERKRDAKSSTVGVMYEVHVDPQLLGPWDFQMTNYYEGNQE
jgi:hypothetical protein